MKNSFVTMQKRLVYALYAIVLCCGVTLIPREAQADSLCVVASAAGLTSSANPGIFQMYCDASGYLDVDVKNTAPTYTPGASYTNQPGTVVIAEPPNGSNVSVVPDPSSAPFPTQGSTASDAVGTINSNATSVTLQNTAGYGGAYIQVTGSWAGTLTFQISTNGGATRTIAAVPGGTQSVNYSQTITSNQSLYFNIEGSSTFSVTSTAWSSGTATVDIHPIQNAPVASVASGTFRGSLPGVVLCFPNNTNVPCANGETTTSDSIGNSNTSMFSSSFNLGYSKTSGAWQRLYVDPYVGGPLYVTDGGANNTPIAPAVTGPVVIRAQATRLVSYVVTSAGTSGNVTFYDNASACSGTIIAIATGTSVDATSVLGVERKPNRPAASGITACGATGSPGLTVTFNY